MKDLQQCERSFDISVYDNSFSVLTTTGYDDILKKGKVYRRNCSRDLSMAEKTLLAAWKQKHFVPLFLN